MSVQVTFLVILFSSMMSSAVMMFLWKASVLTANGICSAFQWVRILKRPKLGRNQTMRAMILLPVAIVLQNTTTIWEVNGRNPFSVWITFLCRSMQLLKLHMVVKIIIVCPCNPKSLVFSNNTPSPLVVGVSVLYKRTRSSWREIWEINSMPKSTLVKRASSNLIIFFFFHQFI